MMDLTAGNAMISSMVLLKTELHADSLLLKSYSNKRGSIVVMLREGGCEVVMTYKETMK